MNKLFAILAITFAILACAEAPTCENEELTNESDPFRVIPGAPARSDFGYTIRPYLIDVQLSYETKTYTEPLDTLVRYDTLRTPEDTTVTSDTLIVLDTLSYIDTVMASNRVDFSLEDHYLETSKSYSISMGEYLNLQGENVESGFDELTVYCQYVDKYAEYAVFKTWYKYTRQDCSHWK